MFHNPFQKEKMKQQASQTLFSVAKATQVWGTNLHSEKDEKVSGTNRKREKQRARGLLLDPCLTWSKKCLGRIRLVF